MHYFDTVNLIWPDGAVVSVVYYWGINTQVKVGYTEFDDKIARFELITRANASQVTLDQSQYQLS